MLDTLLTLILPMWTIWWAPNNVSTWQIGFNSAFKGLISQPRRCILSFEEKGSHYYRKCVDRQLLFYIHIEKRKKESSTQVVCDCCQEGFNP